MISRSGIKITAEGYYAPHSAAVIFFLALSSRDASFSSPFPQSLLSAASMGKRGSTAIGAAASAATKKAKITDTDSSIVGNWVQTKIGDKELSNTEKISILKNDPVESLIAGPEIIPRPPPGFRVIFLAFMLRGLLLACSRRSLCVVNNQPIGNPKSKV
jgi:hypothetical protein